MKTTYYPDNFAPTPREKELIAHYNKALETIASVAKERDEAKHQRDQAIHEANRRDQKWMDGINEAVGRKLDYGDPCSRENASKALGSLVKERDEALAACAAMRGALENNRGTKMDLRAIELAISTDCGKAFLARMKEAEWLLSHADDSDFSYDTQFEQLRREWEDRRDAWLKGDK